jgi:hypothetical protein
VPPDCAVTILADRGFGDHKPFKFLDDLGFGYVIRFRGNIHVTDAPGETRPAADAADLRFGMGLGATRIGEPTRRDRLLLINAFAMVLLTMLGAAESLGMDRLLKSNTPKIRTHSLFRQGCMLYELIPTRRDHSYLHSWPASPRPYQSAARSADFSRSFEMR